MAEDDNGGIKHPLLRRSIDDLRPISGQTFDLNKRRLRRCKSASSANFLHEEQPEVPSLPPLNSTFGKFELRKNLILLFLYLATGPVCFYLLRNQFTGKKTINGVLDSLYFCIVTMTGVGYGDLIPNILATKILICLYIFSGMALVGLLLTKVANYLLEKQELFLLKSLLKIQKFGPEEEALNDNRIMKNNNKCITLFIVLLVLIVVGTAFLATVEKLDIADAFYCVCSTIASLGYGDKSFSTTTGRAFAVFWISISILCLAHLFFTIAEHNTENRQRELVKWILTKRIRNGDLEAADLHMLQSIGLGHRLRSHWFVSVSVNIGDSVIVSDDTEFIIFNKKNYIRLLK